MDISDQQMNHQDEKVEEAFSEETPATEREDEVLEQTDEVPAAETEAGTVDVEETDLEVARREAKENYDKFLRVYAEFENYKKRMERDKSEFLKYANEGLIKELLGVIDNLDRAVGQARQNPESESLVEGVEMILRQTKEIMEKHGVRELQSLGEPFDPNVHEAMMHEVADDHDENTVIDELQKGYVFKDRLIRPALVKVSKKG